MKKIRLFFAIALLPVLFWSCGSTDKREGKGMNLEPTTGCDGVSTPTITSLTVKNKVFSDSTEFFICDTTLDPPTICFDSAIIHLQNNDSKPVALNKISYMWQVEQFFLRTDDSIPANTTKEYKIGGVRHPKQHDGLIVYLNLKCPTGGTKLVSYNVTANRENYFTYPDSAMGGTVSINLEQDQLPVMPPQTEFVFSLENEDSESDSIWVSEVFFVEGQERYYLLGLEAHLGIAGGEQSDTFTVELKGAFSDHTSQGVYLSYSYE